MGEAEPGYKEYLAEVGKAYNRSMGYATVFTQESADAAESIRKVDSLARKANTNLDSLLALNRIIRGLCYSDDSIGKAVEAIIANVNTSFKLHWSKGTPDEAKEAIKEFNKGIAIERFIRDAIGITYIEGNYICYLYSRNGQHCVIRFPLGVATVTSLTQDAEPVCIVDLDAMKKRMELSYPKTKAGRALLQKSFDDEVRNNMPDEIVRAYNAKDRYAVLDVRRTGVVRYMNLGGRYGVSPIAKAIRPRLVLDSAEKRDVANDGAKSTKIIVQRMSDRLLGPDGKAMSMDRARHAHEGLMASMKFNDMVVYTAPPGVEAVEFVEPKVEDVPPEKISMLKSRIMSALGISFADTGSKNWSASQINITQLLRTINAIAAELTFILPRWYKNILHDMGIDTAFTPMVRILDSELLDIALRKDLATVLFNALGCSHETAFGLLSVDVVEEAARRKQENEEGYGEIFAPHKTAYTASGDAGRPSGEDGEKKIYDEGYNDGARD